jgi:hypothetical protein
MSVWLTIPSARPPAEANPALQKWRAAGYKIALYLDSRANLGALNPDVWIAGEYPGYAVAVNRLIGQLIEYTPDAEWFVIGGDDTLPDPERRAEEIAEDLGMYFFCHNPGRYESASTFGVMQPTGDRYAGGQIDRICGSAWIGREFAKRVNQGRGPLWPEYTHMFVDQELQEVAQKLGVLWQRPDVTQLHLQYCRESAALDSGVVEAPVPEHILHDGYTPEHWEKYERLFLKRRAEGFPGSELLNG